jgi:hypothetical protein
MTRIELQWTEHHDSSDLCPGVASLSPHIALFMLINWGFCFPRKTVHLAFHCVGDSAVTVMDDGHQHSHHSSDSTECLPGSRLRCEYI